MKILFTLNPAFNPNDGGVQRTTFKLGKRFTELGHTVTYFSLSNFGNIDVEFGNLFHASNANGANNPENLNELREILHSIKPDFVINQNPYERKLSDCLSDEKVRNGYILLGCLRNSLFSVKNNLREASKHFLPNSIFKLIDNKLGLFILLLFHRLKHKKNLKRILDIHDLFILLTPPNINELKYFVGNYKNQKVKVIPNSIPNIPAENCKKEKIILHVGRLNVPQKRSDLLLEFWEQSYDKLKDWKFVVIGDGPFKDKMIKTIEEKNIPRIKMIGYQKPEDWYSKSSIFIMTSAYEGFPNVILEAQSYGCTPVAFESYDAISWIVANNKNALLIEPFDIKEMSIRTITLANDIDQLSKMGKESRINASQFIVDKVAEKWMNLFEDFKK